jgi:ABC-type Fe3+/spermidine/putrescine transport system ATPase subunit
MMSAASPAPLLQIKEVSRAFGHVHALRGASLDIAENEFFALLGPSGCGKTTLLRILAGFETPDEGEVLLDGSDLLRLPAHRRPVNLMFQSYALFPHMSVARNVAYGLERERLSRDEVTARVDEVLETVGLADKAGSRPYQLSGGQKQRVALARSIVKRPRLLLLDEPLSALDRSVRADMQLELKRLQHQFGITFVVVTHDQEEAMSMADRIAVFREGTVEQVAAPVDLYRRPRTAFVGGFIGEGNFIGGARTERGVAVEGIGDLPGHGDLETGADAVLLIRPESIQLVTSGGHLHGTIIDSHFYGGTSSVVVEVAGLSHPIRVTRPGMDAASREGSVGLTWDASDAVVLAAPDR